MQTEVLIVSCKHFKGVSKVEKGGKPYDFYAGLLVSELGEFEFNTNDEFKSGVDLRNKKFVVEKVELTIKNGKCSIKRVV